MTTLIRRLLLTEIRNRQMIYATWACKQLVAGEGETALSCAVTANHFGDLHEWAIRWLA